MFFTSHTRHRITVPIFCFDMYALLIDNGTLYHTGTIGQTGYMYINEHLTTLKSQSIYENIAWHLQTQKQRKRLEISKSFAPAGTNTYIL